VNLFFKTDLEKASAKLIEAQSFASKAQAKLNDAQVAVASATDFASAADSEDEALRASARLLLANNRAVAAQREASEANVAVENARQAVSDIQDAIAAKQLLAEIDSAKHTASLDDLHSRSRNSARRIRVLSEEIQRELQVLGAEWNKTLEAQALLAKHGVRVDPLNDRHRYSSLALAFLEAAPISTLQCDSCSLWTPCRQQQ